MTMIEQVARAIYDDYEGGVQLGLKELMDNTAKRAIRAMRSPTVDMVEAGCNVHPNFYGVGLHPAVYQYKSMIDAALKDS